MFWRHVWLLTQKNFLVIKRSKKWFFFEILFALLLVPLFAFVVYKTTSEISESRYYGAVRITGDHDDLVRTVPHIQRIQSRMCHGNKTLAYYTKYIEGKRIMNELEKRYSNRKSQILVQKFPSLEAMTKALLDDVSVTANRICGKYIGGVFIVQASIRQKRFNYRIFIPNRDSSEWFTNKFWPDDGPYGALADINSIPSRPNYWSTGFLTFQFALDQIFLKSVNKSLDIDFNVVRFPTPTYRNNGLLAILKTMPILFVLLVLAVMIHTAKEISSEKEAGIKTHLTVMGLRSVAFYASHFVTALLKIIVVMCSASIILSLGFESISPTLFIAFCLAFGISAVLFSILISVLFRSSCMAVSAVLFLWFGLFVLDAVISISPTRLGLCFFSSLNMFTAFHLGLLAMSSYESRLIPLTWLNMFDESTTSFSIGCAFLMLVFDILLQCALIYYLDAVWPTDDSPTKSPFFIFPCLEAPENEIEFNPDGQAAYAEYCEPDSGPGKDEADICIQKMCKIYDGQQIAVDGLSLNAYCGQVTVLLGHNGAGKSTTFSVISGICEPTQGEVFICNKSLSRNLAACQQKIGFCPQYNPLFDKLTVTEHLRLYGKLKDATWDNVDENSIKKLIDSHGLAHKENTLAGSLSGGMKRKLCVAMALIGNSRVVLLDEPTAGMDPEARNDICRMLEAEKKHRTILLTTHYMEEADKLGDQIAIMVKGKLVCKGSPDYLKNRFGTGYVLTFVLDSKSNQKMSEEVVREMQDTIIKHMRKYVHNAKVESTCGYQFSVILPTSGKQHFANLFEELEQHKTELGISSFGLSHNTLEQVFLKVGEIADNQHSSVETPTKLAEWLFDGSYSHDRELFKPSLYFRQITAVIQRYSYNAFQNKLRTFLPLALAVFFFAALAFAQFDSSNVQQKDLSLLTQEPLTIPICLASLTRSPVDFGFIGAKLYRSRVLSISPATNLTEQLLFHAYDSPALGIGGYVAPNGSVFAYFNGAAFHGPPLAVSFISNSLLAETPDSIRASIEIYSSAENAQENASVTVVFANILTIICFSFLTSVFVMPLVEDRISRFKHQLLLTKLNTFRYWIAVTIWNAGIYILFCFILACILGFSGWMKSCMTANIAFWFFYFWSAVPYVYVASFIFTSPTKAFAALLCWNVIAGIMASGTIAIAEAFTTEEIKNVMTILFSILLPSFALGHGVMRVTLQCPVNVDVSITDFSEIGKIMACMFVSGLFFWIYLLYLENTFHCVINKFTHRFQRLYQSIEAKDDTDELDIDVKAERDRMTFISDEDLALSVRNVSKNFDNFRALKNLTFGVDPTDCFGLLGVNGAGKTTTFDILTGKLAPSSGSASIRGVSIDRMPPIGYCPQFDALAGDLTGRQLLTIIGNLNGFANTATRVGRVLDGIHMIKHADKVVCHYSGGQKRRLSIGLTLMSRASLIMLDEPTAGIDPKTRRQIWNLLSAVRDQKVAMLLTSHSMDECEALCSRIGFLNRGSLISIGTSQHLKSRYGNSFLLTFTITKPGRIVFQYLDKVVTQEFQCPPCVDPPYTPVLHWEVPRQGNDSWSGLYRKAQKIATRFAVANFSGDERPVIKDFSVTQNSLEQVFLRLTQLSDYSCQRNQCCIETTPYPADCAAV